MNDMLLQKSLHSDLNARIVCIWLCSLRQKSMVLYQVEVLRDDKLSFRLRNDLYLKAVFKHFEKWLFLHFKEEN